MLRRELVLDLRPTSEAQQVAFFFARLRADIQKETQSESRFQLEPQRNETQELLVLFFSICSRHCVCVVLREQRKTHSGNLPERVVRFNFLIQCPRACEVSNKNMFMQSVSIFDFSIPSLPLTTQHTHTLLSIFNYLQFWRGGKKRNK